VLDALGGADQRSVLRGRVAVLLHHLLAFGDEPLHCLAHLGRRRDAELAERLVDPLQVTARLLEVVLDGLPQLVVMRRLRHLRQRLDELLLGAVQILELFLQDVIERMEPHEFLLFESYSWGRGSALVELQTGEAGLRCRGA
jgi:hypothetical protein